MTDLILSGGWFGKRGIYEAIIRGFKFIESIEELSLSKQPVFVIISYDLSRHTTGIDIKTSGYPKIILIEIQEFVRFRYLPRPYEIYYKGTVMSDTEYKNAIAIIKQKISDGIIYQVNLTNRFDFLVADDVVSLAIDFYHRQPVPYFFCLNNEDFVLMSGSMELFLSKNGYILKGMPIKGTSTDRKALRMSKKDRAENLMITDMMRNDIGRVSTTGSISVPELFKITRYKTLYQMHSTVIGVCDRGINEIISYTFPPASVTGAPKIKAVEIIDCLEPHQRGYYCGCAGLVMPNGDFTLSVLIRTAYGRGNQISYFAGCGIVWDSDSDMELGEMYLKVRAFYPIKNSMP